MLLEKVKVESLLLVSLFADEVNEDSGPESVACVVLYISQKASARSSVIGGLGLCVICWIWPLTAVMNGMYWLAVG